MDTAKFCRPIINPTSLYIVVNPPVDNVIVLSSGAKYMDYLISVDVFVAL